MRKLVFLIGVVLLLTGCSGIKEEIEATLTEEPDGIGKEVSEISHQTSETISETQQNIIAQLQRVVDSYRRRNNLYELYTITAEDIDLLGTIYEFDKNMSYDDIVKTIQDYLSELSGYDYTLEETEDAIAFSLLLNKDYDHYIAEESLSKDYVNYEDDGYNDFDKGLPVHMSDGDILIDINFADENKYSPYIGATFSTVDLLDGDEVIPLVYSDTGINVQEKLSLFLDAYYSNYEHELQYANIDGKDYEVVAYSTETHDYYDIYVNIGHEHYLRLQTYQQEGVYLDEIITTYLDDKIKERQ